MIIKGKHVIRIKFNNGVVSKAYIVSREIDSMTVRTANGFDYEVRDEPNAKNEYVVIG